MVIGVISDTHAHLFEELPDKLLAALSGVNLIIHAGDIVAVAILKGLEQIAEVKTVQGNMDSDEIKASLPQKELLVVNGKKIGIIHGWGGPWGIEHRIRKAFDNVDIIVYGHSHQTKNELIEGILFFNPGLARKSFGILTLGEEVRGEIIRF